MNKKDTIEFFDRLAPTWDTDLITDDSVIAKILDAARIGEGSHILEIPTQLLIQSRDSLCA